MKANYEKIDSIVPFLLMAFCGITLSGCGDDSITVSKLFTESDEYEKGNKIKVDGQIVDIQLEGTSFLVLLSDDNSGDAPILICEFLEVNQEGFPVKGQRVTISGKVDILAGITFLRECRLVQ